MTGLLTRILVTGIAVFLAISIVPGIEVQSWSAGLAAVLVLTILNALVRPLLYVMSLPLILLSFGLFMVLINAVLLELVAYLVKGFIVTGLWPAILGALVISIVTTILTAVTSTQIRAVRVEDPHERRPPRHIN
ncbi:MAG: phage holin family protein [Nitrospiraceae bacterium]